MAWKSEAGGGGQTEEKGWELEVAGVEGNWFGLEHSYKEHVFRVQVRLFSP